MLSECEEPVVLEDGYFYIDSPRLFTDCGYQQTRDVLSSRIARRVNDLSPVATFITDISKSKMPFKEVVVEVIKQWNPFFRLEYAFQKVLSRKILDLEEDDGVDLLLKRMHFLMVCYKMPNGFLKVVDCTTIRSEDRKFLFSKERIGEEGIKQWYLNFKVCFYSTLRSLSGMIKNIPEWNSLKVEVYDELSFNVY